MRVLLYGMQSSGASLVTFFLAQAPRSVGVIDLWNSQLMPPLDVADADHVIAKAVVTLLYSLDDHVQSFRPDRTLLVLRDPMQNYVALSRKYYADESGSIDEKFARLEHMVLRREAFDVVLLYEDFIQHQDETIRALRRVGITAEPEFYRFPRDRQEMKDFAFDQSDWCREFYEKRWKFGNVQGSQLRRRSLHKYVPGDVKRRVKELCPSVCALYDEYYARTGESAFTRYRRGLWYDRVLPGSQAAARRVRRLVLPSVVTR